MLKLPKTFKAKWLAKLRSGNLKQGKGKLWDGAGYCCLGVACVVAGRVDVKDPSVWGHFYYPSESQVSKQIYAVLNQHVDGDLFGWYNGNTENETLRSVLSILNDGSDHYSVRRHSFAEIADLIEKHL